MVKKANAPKPESGSKIKKLEQRIEELTKSLQIERADAINLRRRFNEEKAGLASFHKANVVREILPVIDNFDRALKHVPDDLEGSDYVKGVNGVMRQFEDILSKLGVERIKTVGAEFNPELHEAVSMEEGDGDKEIVSEELQSGYMLGDQVIRHAVVRVKR